MKKLLIVCGFSFAGKTTFAHALTRRLGYVEVDVDQTKVGLYGAHVQDEELSRAQWDRIYAETDAQIIAHLQNGEAVIDASRHFTRAERHHSRSLVQALGCEAIIIYLNTPEVIVRQRWQENRRTRFRRDVSDHDFEAIIRAMEPPLPDEQPWIIEYGDNIEHWIAQHTTFLPSLAEEHKQTRVEENRLLYDDDPAETR